MFSCDFILYSSVFRRKDCTVHVGTLLKCMLLMLLDACYVESLSITAMFLLKYC